MRQRTLDKNEEEIQSELLEIKTKTEELKIKIGEAILEQLRSDSMKKKVIITSKDTNVIILEGKVGLDNAAYIFSPYCSKLDKSHDVESKQATNINIRALSEVNQRHIIDLCETISSSSTGHTLWQQIKLKITSMPGWWRFFNDLRGLTSTLGALLEEYHCLDLKRADIAYLTKLTEVLMKCIKQLMEKIAGLQEMCRELMNENNELKDAVNDKDGTFRKLKFLEEETERLRVENKTLLEVIQVLESEMKRILDENSNQDAGREEDENSNYQAFRGVYDSMKKQNARLVEAMDELQQQLDVLEEKTKILKDEDGLSKGNIQSEDEEIENEDQLESDLSTNEKKRNAVLESSADGDCQEIRRRLNDQFHRFKPASGRDTQRLWNGASRTGGGSDKGKGKEKMNDDDQTLKYVGQY